jgi:hypothetical protein
VLALTSRFWSSLLTLLLLDRLFTIDNAVTKGYVSTKLNSDATFTVANSAISWQALVNLKAMAKERYIRPIRTKDGVDFYHAFLTPTAMASLKTDSDFIQIQRDAGKRGAGNERVWLPVVAGRTTVLFMVVVYCSVALRQWASLISACRHGLKRIATSRT